MVGVIYDSGNNMTKSRAYRCSKISINTIQKLCTIQLGLVVMGIFFSVGLSGCDSSYLRKQSSGEQEFVDIQHDWFRGETSFTGNEVDSLDQELERDGVVSLFLTAKTERNKESHYYLNIVNNYHNGMREYNCAYDGEGAKINAFTISHQLRCEWLCGYDETLQLELSKKYLTKHLADGISLRLYGPASTKSTPIKVPPKYLNAMLEATQ